MSYMRTVGEARAAALEAAASSARSVGAGGTDDNRVPWQGDEGLARGRDEELWPPLVFSMGGMCEGFRRRVRFSQGRVANFCNPCENLAELGDLRNFAVLDLHDSENNTTLQKQT